MAKVTDQDYYIDKYLLDLMDLVIERQKKGWDNVIIIDGKERAGKSTLARQLAYYYAYCFGKTISIDNVYFDPEMLMEAATKTKENIFIWDEAAFGGLSNQWYTKTQMKMNQTLMTTGKYHHLYIMIIPSIFRLNKYLALDRSLALIHVYSPDLISRGHYVCLNEQQKAFVYLSNKQTEGYGKQFSFQGNFSSEELNNIIGNEEYEKKKDEAIQKFILDNNNNPTKKTYELQKKICSVCSVEEATGRFGIALRSYYNWRKIIVKEQADGNTIADLP